MRYERQWLLWAIVSFALINGVLYTVLLPLWEGFDEAFHYGYVQELSTRRSLPVPGHSGLTEEVWDSLLLAPVSSVVQGNIPEAQTFHSFFALPEVDRRERRKALDDLSPAKQYDLRVDRLNYEAHQAPLAYAILSIPDVLLARQPLLIRVRLLRLIASALSILLTAWAAIALCRQMGLPAPFVAVVLLLTFSSQMFYATTSHIANDWLSVPLVSWLLVAAIRANLRPGVFSTSCFALVLALGLLTKSYFLAFLPLFVGMIVVGVARRRTPATAAIVGVMILGLVAGPWYLRNLRVNHSISGMQEEEAGIGVSKVVESADTVPWAESIRYMARASLWTGNNHFTTFSRKTLNAVLLLLAIGGCFYLRVLHKTGFGATDVIVLSATGLFILAVAYVTVVAYVNTHGLSAGASPWYMQVLLVPVLILVMRGLAEAGWIGRILVLVQAILWMYVLLATYTLKLIPQYGGHDEVSIHAPDLMKWYLYDGSQRDAILSTTALASPTVLYALVLTVSVSGLALLLLVFRGFAHVDPGPHTRP